MPNIQDESSQPATRLIAPLWHTLIVLLLLFGLSASGAYSHRFSPLRSHSRALSYLMVIALEWLIVAFIWLGLRLRGMRLPELIGGRWPSAKAILRDFALALGFLLAANIVLETIALLLKAKAPPAVRNLLPHGNLQVVLYLLLALTAGICEEIIFRGYLQKQFSSLFRNTSVGLLLQGIAFGAAHGYQGRKMMLVIAVYGCLFGLLAAWRRSLRPGMMAHFLQDGVLGLLIGYAAK